MKINYESFDGHFYRLEPTELPKIDDEEWPNRCYPWESIVDLCWDLEMTNKKHFLFKQVRKENNPTPIVRAGKDHSRCPHCGERKCLIEGELMTGFCNKPLKKVVEYRRENKMYVKPLIRKIYSCTSPKIEPKSKLFILEYLEHESSDFAAFCKTLRTKHCLVCNARWDMISFETSVTKNIYKNDDSNILIIVLWCEVCGTTLADNGITLKQGQKAPKSKEEIIELF